MATQVESGRPSSARPTGTVTFLFSDIEGSTARWDADSAAMAAALSRHDAILREKLQAHRAYIFKTMGDAFCAAFAQPRDAIGAAIETQRALRAEDFSGVQGLPVRMAVHTGTADERDGDYFGPAVNRVARLLAIAHGGQVLISGAAAGLLGADMPSECSVRGLGEHRLKDLALPEQVWQLSAPGLPQSFPPLRSLEHLTNNLPAQLTTLVGRSGVLAEIKRALAEHRLVTLTGVGGAGKTRCAIAAGAQSIDDFDDGVWLVELAPISDSGFIAIAVAQTLRLKEEPNRPILDTVVTHLKRKRMLLILDNCEHLIDEARAVVTAILRECGGVRILTTSREPLSIAGEATYRMPSLAIPPHPELLFSEGAAAFGAAQLFVDRALAGNDRFALTQENAPFVGEICRRLDGIPLAIELAAARVKVLSPQQLLQKLDERFRILTGGDRSALPRHQTMRALIDWSYDLLSDEERSFFRMLSIFAGGFTLETAAAVHPGDDAEVLDRLSSLVDKSLVQAEPGENGVRYKLLESTREYAREKLAQSGEEQRVSRAHARAYGELAEGLETTWERIPDAQWLASIDRDMENYRAALAWAFAPDGDTLIGQRLALYLRKVWLTAFVTEGRRWICLAQEHVHAGTPAEVVAAVDLAQASFAGRFHQFETSLTCGERALARYRDVVDPVRRAMAKEIVADALVMLGRIGEGEALLREALEERRAQGASKSVAGVLLLMGQAREFAGDAAAARKLYGEAMAAARSANGERLAALVANNLAEAEFRHGDTASALWWSSQALSDLRALRDTQLLSIALCNRSAYLLDLQRYDEARGSAAEALAAMPAAEQGAPYFIALQHLAAVAALRPDGAQDVEDRRLAARILGYVDACFAALEGPRDHTEQVEYEAALSRLRRDLDENDLTALMSEGAAWSAEQAAECAMLV
ncbi:MAG TPA: adenylate/guanylate cyclase domain-containing protein [Candidatus Baltobacteraceae bacterium]|jgi:predicted ATPase/class 3 adenylate cyclase|nr:adenylate/guanylate cyclase domain-containing protein [Candidatus Baltobacteraceae bacterium]